MYIKEKKATGTDRFPRVEQLELVETEVLDENSKTPHKVQEWKTVNLSIDDRKFLKYSDFNIANMLKNGLEQTLTEVSAKGMSNMQTQDHIDAGLELLNRINKQFSSDPKIKD